MAITKLGRGRMIADEEEIKTGLILKVKSDYEWSKYIIKDIKELQGYKYIFLEAQEHDGRKGIDKWVFGKNIVRNSNFRIID